MTKIFIFAEFDLQLLQVVQSPWKISLILCLAYYPFEIFCAYGMLCFYFSELLCNYPILSYLDQIDLQTI